jgi:hypothetical protein
MMNLKMTLAQHKIFTIKETVVNMMPLIFFWVEVALTNQVIEGKTNE